MDNSVKITSIIVGAILVLALLGGLIYYQKSSGRTIEVDGNAVITTNPDVISVYFNVETNGQMLKKLKMLIQL